MKYLPARANLLLMKHVAKFLHSVVFLLLPHLILSCWYLNVRYLSGILTVSRLKCWNLKEFFRLRLQILT